MSEDFLNLDPSPELTAAIRHVVPGAEVRTSTCTREGVDYNLASARVKFSDGFICYAMILVETSKPLFSHLGQLVDIVKETAWKRAVQ